MEKNYFAILNYRLLVALGFTITVSGYWMVGMIGPLTGSLAGRAAGLGLFSICIPAAMVARRLGWSPGGAILVPFILPLTAYAVFNSAVVTLRQGGVRWRDTFYPLKVLRRWNVR